MLKSIYKFLLLIFCLFIAFPVYAEEYIEQFDSNIIVNPDGSLTVAETITVHHEGEQIKRGIYRDLSTAKGERYKVLNVMRNGNPEPWFTEKNGNALRVNTGNDDFLPPGTSTFTIIYNIYDVLRPIKDMDLNEIYLNVTGRWNFPIKLVTAEVSYPEGTDVSSRYAYIQGETYNYTSLPNHAYAFSDLPINAELTIAEAFSQGTVHIPFPYTWKLLIISFIVMFIYYFVAWLQFGIDPSSRAIMPEWEPPADLSPLECAYIANNGKTPQNSFFTHILWLIHQKALALRELQKGQFSKPKGYELTILPTADKSNYETKLFISNFQDGLTAYANEPDEDILSYDQKLDKTISKHLEKIAYHKRDLLTFLGAIFVPATFLILWGDTNIFNAALFAATILPPMLSAGIYGIIIAALFCFPIILNLIETDILLVAIFGLYVATVMVFKYLMFQPTVYGQRQKEKIEGIKMFLSTITQSHIALKEHLPNKTSYDMSMRDRLTPEDMEALFPYAVALGLEKEWERKFKSIFDTTQWISMTERNDYFKNNRFKNFKECTQSSINTFRSASRYSRGTGSFGGGFSGGGFGGGGGGGR